MLNDPAEVEVAPRNTASELVSQTVHLIAKERKRALLSFLIGSNRWKQVLVFTKTKHGANRLAEQLGKDGIEAMAIHGNKSQGARTRALAQFKDGSLPVLVATDIAARGLDIDDLPHVVNYELPHVPEDYVHRIGRTGRAGREGSAVSLVDREEVKLLAAIERVIKRPIQRVEVDGFTGLQSRPGDAELDQADDRPPRAPSRGNQRSGAPGATAGGDGRGGPRNGQPARAPQGQPARSAQPRPAPCGPGPGATATAAAAATAGNVRPLGAHRGGPPASGAQPAASRRGERQTGCSRPAVPASKPDRPMACRRPRSTGRCWSSPAESACRSSMRRSSASPCPRSRAT